ncbi:tRNA (34-2'-O)-methyltransferase regulator WDR6 [Pholidichthys leucotaenia]
METVALLAPVTALEFVQDSFLLTGEGPILSVYSLHPRPKACTSLNVLQHYKIHGIRPACPSAETKRSPAKSIQKEKHGPSCAAEPHFTDLAVFGGKAVRLVRAHTHLLDGEHGHLEVLGPLMELQDWVLDLRWLLIDKQSLLCVALAHNSTLLLDVTAGRALVHSFCLESCLLYSALLLVHTSWADTVLVGGTVFNQLVVWRPGGRVKSGDSEHKAPIEQCLCGHTGVIFCISYCQERGYLASASDDRSVRVWDVGALGGPGGTCGNLNPACLWVLYGHQARVFSVRLSLANVFSAGEDGACIVWDLARSGKVVRRLKGHRAGGVRALAVSEGAGTEERWVATGGADGGVRVWRVEGREEKEKMEEETVTEKLTDLKFPGQGLPKAVCIEAEDEAMQWSQIKFVVCTDKGTVWQYRDEKWAVLWQGPPEFQSYCVMETVTANVKDSTTKAPLCAVGTLSGSIQVFPTSHPQSGIILAAGSGKIHSLIWHKGKDNTYLLASGAEGLVYRWSVEVKLGENHSLCLSINPLTLFFLPPCAKRWLTAAVLLRSWSKEMLWVCGDRRGSLILFHEREESEQTEGDEEVGNEDLLLDGKVNNHKEVPAPNLQPLSCLFGVHGKQGVTSVYEHKGLLYSTGRDGCVRVFRVYSMLSEKCKDSRQNSAGESMKNKERLQLEVLRVQRACKGMEWVERILILEPEREEEEDDEEVGEECLLEKLEDLGLENEGREARFAVVGFHAVHFVVWDPVRQEKLLMVPCGGGHRSWSLWPSHRGLWPGYGALVFIKQGAILVSHPPREELNGIQKAGRIGGWALRDGIHGRGIGCVCRLGSIEGEGKQWELVVTGGEDTSLTVLAIQSLVGSIEVLSVITDHISSVRTVTALTHSDRGTENQSKSLSALLVSAGGRAQIQCYRLQISWDRLRLTPACQVIQVAGHRLDKEWERRRNRHKMVKMDPETRYMSIAVVDEKADWVLIALSCSDGAVRLFSVSEDKSEINLLWETFYHQRCVLSVATCSLEVDEGSRCNLLFSAATDGKIAVWNLTDEGSATPPPIPCLVIPAHQSGVNSLAVWTETPEQQQGGCLVTIASGGDDGQLSVLTMRVQHPEDGSSNVVLPWIPESRTALQTQLKCSKELQLHLHSQHHIPLAHAAPLTALKLLRPGLVVSTSSDQRVCLWKISSTSISHRGALCSHVADAAGLAVWEGLTMDREEGDEMAGIESEQEISCWGEKGSRTGLETASRSSEHETAGRFDKETGDESKWGRLVEAGSETGDPVCKTHKDGGGERTDDPETQTDSDSMEIISEVNTETGVKDSSEKPDKTGWVLVCGQGLQLLQIRNTVMHREHMPRENGRGWPVN